MALTHSEPSRHLDIGCGGEPRNPYRCASVSACDLAFTGAVPAGIEFRAADLSAQPIPFPDHHFASVSAFDFLEHVPRQMREASGALRNPFVELMNEIHRVLQPGGRLLAITPAFPHPAAFTDPTHVNIITEQTHTYFTGPEPGASIYGFRGRFTLLQARRETPANAYDQQEPALRKLLRRSHRQLMYGGLSHMLWEFEAA